MHIADGLLDLSVLLPLWIVVLIYGGFVFYRLRSRSTQMSLPIVGSITAMVFAFQMLNFPISAGTSGHLLGFIIMAVLFDQYYAFLMISTVLIIQAFVFADGGILALGANIFNMGVIPLVGYGIYLLIAKQPWKNSRLIGAGVGAYISLICASLACGIEIGLSSNFPFGIEITVPAMLGYHAIIGIGEAFITVVVVGLVTKYAPNYFSKTIAMPKEVPV